MDRATPCSASRRGTWSGTIAVAAIAILLLAPHRPLGAQRDIACSEDIDNFRRAAADSSRERTSDMRARLDTLRRRARACVEAIDSARQYTALKQIAPTADSLAMAVFRIPEYHDEGRLPIAGNLLGPMAFIYASPFLGTFTRKAQIFEHGVPGILAAIVVVEDAVSMPPEYAALHLTNGTNCVWLRARGADPTAAYEAYVTHVPNTEPCDHTGTRFGPLDVVEVSDPRFRFSESYPPVARFDEDRDRRPVLAFKCLVAFCEVGSGLTPAKQRRSKVHPNPVPPGTPRQKIIKGWHDEQQLAERAGGMWRGSGIWASIIPDTGISNYDSVMFENVWVPAARIVIHNPLPATHKYYAWGLRRGDNFVGVQFDVAANQWLMGIFPNQFDAPMPGARVPRKRWRVVDRMLHRDAAVPATARFRFTLADDGVWVPCGNACCKSDGEIF